jgi:Family of unknown function (DUF5995)
MGWGRGSAATLLVSALLVPVALGGASASSVPNVNWVALLPALESPGGKPGAVAHCRKPSMKCVRVEIRRMRELQERLGCDHRSVFATTYLELTRMAKRTLKADPHFLRFKRFFFVEDALFANVYFRTFRAWERGEEVPGAWRIAFEAARDKDLTAAQDMLLGINAHVQNDMPYVLAKLGLRTRKGRSRKVDHDAFNAVLNQAYEPVVRAVGERFDPSISLTNADWHPVDDVGGLEIVREWREQVWRNAERLANAETADEREAVSQQIEDSAADWAAGIAAVETPGWRAERDAYCAAQLAD